MVELYRPSNGTEGCSFVEQWCGNCQRSKPGQCAIYSATLVNDVEDPDYPKQWIYGHRGPECTAFVLRGEPLPPERCSATMDMFGAADNTGETTWK